MTQRLFKTVNHTSLNEQLKNVRTSVLGKTIVVPARRVLMFCNSDCSLAYI